MIIHANPTHLAGTAVCGQVLALCDDDSVYAVYELSNCACGVTVETGSARPYLRLTPAVQVPTRMCRGFARAMFEADDETLDDLELDERDGEVTMRVRLESADADELERTLAEALSWVDGVGYPAVMRYVRDVIAREEGEEKVCA